MERPAIRFRGPVLDAPEGAAALELAAFYERLLGWRVAQSAPGGWALLESGDGQKLEVQGLPDYRRPTWPNTADEQQMMLHLDFATDDVEAAVAWATDAGATTAEFQPRPAVRVMLDPAGHPFCLFVGAGHVTSGTP